MRKQHIIAYRNNKGGVARTTLAAHTLFLGAELGLKVAGVSLDEQNDLALWMQGANLPWFNGLCDDLPTDFDLLVFDVRKNSPLDEVLCLGVNLWLLPVDNTRSRMCFPSSPVLWDTGSLLSRSASSLSPTRK